ncbi:hypothetical protein [Geodermatophilus ruber]|uniref:Uncharacterized protein n=1 Tax=Geodermatophilus ruber TaxID=504800 RepID=A0A1I4DGL8_9ACTN|nr:hypothetical protein [Geodermatophilus ruber]SFK91930.1 hypothetical protein SAMN04488085_104352 [Geodermatophilus ruber]
MSWVWIVALVWVLLSIPAALVIGRCLQSADRAELDEPRDPAGRRAREGTGLPRRSRPTPPAVRRGAHAVHREGSRRVHGAPAPSPALSRRSRRRPPGGGAPAA